MTRLLITIDTEPDCDIHWRRSDPLAFTSITEGIPLLLRPIWNQYDVKPIYFVSPEVLSDPKACIVLKQEVAQGAIIGTHLHSEYIAPSVTLVDAAGKASLEYPCYAHSTQVEKQKLENFTRLIREKLGVDPVWYRAGRYGADLDTMKSLSALGYRYDSSVTPGINWQSQGGPDHSSGPLQPYWISKENYYRAASQRESLGIREFPITIFEKRLGFLGSFLPNRWIFYNWLRPTLMSLLEQKWLIKKLKAKFENPTLVMMFHSNEIIPNMSPYVRNRWMQKRFLNNLKAVLRYLKEEQGAEFTPEAMQTFESKRA